MSTEGVPQEVERFEIQQDADEAAEVSEFGPWVRYEEHAAALARLRQQVLAEVQAFKPVLAAHLINLAPVDERFSLNEVEDAFDRMLATLSNEEKP